MEALGLCSATVVVVVVQAQPWRRAIGGLRMGSEPGERLANHGSRAQEKQETQEETVGQTGDEMRWMTREADDRGGSQWRRGGWARMGQTAYCTTDCEDFRLRVLPDRQRRAGFYWPQTSEK
ncbi:hypothetical protein EDC01DRAFT_680222 [Geopyxis carbonaria]|nr:hypothetical protein EDC01DRAFT_680222 [Geopyxis carbonaria]